MKYIFSIMATIIIVVFLIVWNSDPISQDVIYNMDEGYCVITYGNGSKSYNSCDFYLRTCYLNKEQIDSVKKVHKKKSEEFLESAK